MKFTIVALVLAVCLVQSSEAYWGGLYGGMFGGYGMGMGMYGMGGYRMGMWGKRSTTEDKPVEYMLPVDRTECLVFDRNSTILLCRGLVEEVECKIELRWGMEEFKVYGIAKSETTPRSYRLLPRTMTNSAWLDNTLLVDGVSKQVSLFGSENLDHIGLRVIDEACFNRLDNLFKVSERNEKVYVKTEGLTEMPTAFLIGDLIITDWSKETSKRHGGGYSGGYSGGRGGGYSGGRGGGYSGGRGGGYSGGNHGGYHGGHHGGYRGGHHGGYRGGHHGGNRGGHHGGNRGGNHYG